MPSKRPSDTACLRKRLAAVSCFIRERDVEKGNWDTRSGSGPNYLSIHGGWGWRSELGHIYARRRSDMKTSALCASAQLKQQMLELSYRGIAGWDGLAPAIPHTASPSARIPHVLTRMRVRQKFKPAPHAFHVLVWDVLSRSPVYCSPHT